jgi:hypothetical protein
MSARTMYGDDARRANSVSPNELFDLVTAARRRHRPGSQPTAAGDRRK